MTTAARRAPRQARSRQTLERILQAAGRTIDETGIGGATMEAFAQRAGVSIGALYRFFPDRQAVVDALQQRWEDHLGTAFRDVHSPTSLARDADDVVSDFVRRLPSVLDEMPGGRGLIAESIIKPPVGTDESWTRQVEAFIARYAPRLSPDRRRVAASTYLTITYALMVAAVRAGKDMDRQLVEARSVLTGYIRELVTEVS